MLRKIRSCTIHGYGISRRAAPSFLLVSSAERLAQSITISTVAHHYHVLMTAFGTLWSHRLFFKFLRGQKQCLLSQGKVPWKSLCTTPIARQALESNSEKASDKNKRPRKKTRSTIELQSLPQGLLVSPKTEHVVKKDPVQYPTVFQQVRNNMRKYDDCVVITRLGNFYEV